MRGSDSQGTPHPARMGAESPPATEPGAVRFPRRWSEIPPEQGDPPDDMLERLPTEPSPAPFYFPGVAPDTLTASWLRGRIRFLLKEFLSAVPRSEPETTIALLRPDGVTCVLTRAQLSVAIDQMRPRMRQIVRLAVEERWPRQRVCDYLNHISLKTYERDHAEAFDVLLQFIEEY